MKNLKKLEDDFSNADKLIDQRLNALLEDPIKKFSSQISELQETYRKNIEEHIRSSNFENDVKAMFDRQFSRFDSQGLKTVMPRAPKTKSANPGERKPRTSD